MSLLVNKLLVGCGLVVLLCASGITFGWTALEVALKRDGIYGNLTPSNRNTKLQLVMTTASCCVSFGGEASLSPPTRRCSCGFLCEFSGSIAVRCAAGIIFGFLLDAFGPAATNAAAGVIFVAGCFVFGFQLSLPVGYGMIALGGAGLQRLCIYFRGLVVGITVVAVIAGILASGFRLGGVFPAYTAYIMTAITCCFDSSTVVFAVREVFILH